jgi:hypothetical protein
MKFNPVFITNERYTIAKLGYANNLTGKKKKKLFTSGRKNKAEYDL